MLQLPRWLAKYIIPLGSIYENMDFTSKQFGGQYFTPWTVASIIARMNLAGMKPRDRVLTVAEPSCGSGRLVLALAAASPPNPFWVDATDIDPVCQQMAYIQLSHAGIPAIVRCGNSLTGHMEDAGITAAGYALLMNHPQFAAKLFGPRAHRQQVNRDPGTRQPCQRS